MRIHQVLSIAGGSLLVCSTVIPSHYGNMWSALSLIDQYIILGALPIVMSLSGILGAVMGFRGKSIVPLLCGIAALFWLLFAVRFQVFLLVFQPFFLVTLIGCVVMTAAGITGMSANRS